MLNRILRSLIRYSPSVFIQIVGGGEITHIFLERERLVVAIERHRAEPTHLVGATMHESHHDEIAVVFLFDDPRRRKLGALVAAAGVEAERALITRYHPVIGDALNLDVFAADDQVAHALR